MPLTARKTNTRNNSAQANPDSNVVEMKAKQRDRYVLAGSECYFEPAEYIQPAMNADKVTALFKNPAMEIAETEGRSLKVMFQTGSEVKFIGFITAGDGSVELTEDDVDTIMNDVSAGEITKAITADELVDLF